MIVAVLEELLYGREAAQCYIIDTSLVTDPILRKQIENDEDTEVSPDEAYQLEVALIKPPQLVEKIFTLWVDA